MRKMLVVMVLNLFICSIAYSDDNSIAKLTENALKSINVDVESVKIADGKAKGGVRSMIIGYTARFAPGNSKNGGDLIKVLEAGCAANEHSNANLDETSAVLGDKSGKAIAMFSVKVADTKKYLSKKNPTNDDLIQYLSKINAFLLDKRYFKNTIGYMNQIK